MAAARRPQGPQPRRWSLWGWDSPGGRLGPVCCPQIPTHLEVPAAQVAAAHTVYKQKKDFFSNN